MNTFLRIFALLALSVAPAALLRAEMPKSEVTGRILIAVTNHEQLGNTGKKTGFYLSEVAHPWKVFKDAGFEVAFISPDGGFAPMDPKSLDKEDPVNKEFLAHFPSEYGLEESLSPAEADPADYRAIWFAGGHGTMWDFPEARQLQTLAAKIYEGNGVVAAVCHGPSVLAGLRLEDGSFLVEGKNVTGFTNSEEEAVELTDVMPFLLETKLEEMRANFSKADDFQPHVVADDRLVTAQNPASATPGAEKVVQVLKGE